MQLQNLDTTLDVLSRFILQVILSLSSFLFLLSFFFFVCVGGLSQFPDLYSSIRVS